MSSLTRRIQRNIKRRQGTYESPPQQTVVNDDGSVSVLHPTKGWRRMSAQRFALYSTEKEEDNEDQ